MFTKNFCNIINPKKTIVILNDGDLGRIKDKVIKANAEEVKDQTGFSIGGVSPFVHLNNPKKTFIDDNLNKYETIYAAAGHPHVVFGIKFKDILELSEGNIEDIVE